MLKLQPRIRTLSQNIAPAILNIHAKRIWEMACAGETFWFSLKQIIKPSNERCPTQPGGTGHPYLQRWRDTEESEWTGLANHISPLPVYYTCSPFSYDTFPRLFSLSIKTLMFIPLVNISQTSLVAHGRLHLPSARARDRGLSPGPGGSHVPWSNQVRRPQLLSLCRRAWEP